jgi:FtsP/CotA-like multicopper oxidase with cupredoxin domain
MQSHELWKLKTGGGWFHPIHIHLVGFIVVARNRKPPRSYEARGIKDVVYLGRFVLVEAVMAASTVTGFPRLQARVRRSMWLPGMNLPSSFFAGQDVLPSVPTLA